MAKLQWDVDGTRRYETGVDHGVLYLQTTGEDGKVSYPKGVAWNGLSSVSESPSGADASPIYADNMKYLNLMAAEDFGATIEAYTYPDEWAQCDGSAELSAGVVVGQQVRKPFGLCYRTKVGTDANPDAGYKLHLIYNAKASPSERSYSTVNDSPEAITFSWTVTTTPVAFDGNMNAAACVTIDSTKADKTKLNALEELLFGTDSAEAKLPTLEEVKALFAA